MCHANSIMFVSSFVCMFDFPGKHTQKSHWWSPPALVDEDPQNDLSLVIDQIVDITKSRNLREELSAKHIHN